MSETTGLDYRVVTPLPNLATETHETASQTPFSDQGHLENVIPVTKETTLKPRQGLVGGSSPESPLPPGHIVCTSCNGKGHVVQGLNLVSELRKRPKPLNITQQKPGEALKGLRWICCMCEGRSEVKKSTNDVRRHLREKHGFLTDDLDVVFSPWRKEALYEHFGPCTIAQARENRFDFRPWKDGSSTSTKSSATRSVRRRTRQQHNQPTSLEEALPPMSTEVITSSFNDSAHMLLGAHLGDDRAIPHAGNMDSNGFAPQYGFHATNNANYFDHLGAGGPQVEHNLNPTGWHPIRDSDPADLQNQTPASSPPFDWNDFNFSSTPTSPCDDKQHDCEGRSDS